MERNTVERAIKTQEQNKREWASSAGLYGRHKPQHPLAREGEPVRTGGMHDDMSLLPAFK